MFKPSVLALALVFAFPGVSQAQFAFGANNYERPAPAVRPATSLDSLDVEGEPDMVLRGKNLAVFLGLPYPGQNQGSAFWFAGSASTLSTKLECGMAQVCKGIASPEQRLYPGWRNYATANEPGKVVPRYVFSEENGKRVGKRDFATATFTPNGDSFTLELVPSTPWSALTKVALLNSLFKGEVQDPAYGANPSKWVGEHCTGSPTETGIALECGGADRSSGLGQERHESPEWRGCKMQPGNEPYTYVHDEATCSTPLKVGEGPAPLKHFSQVAPFSETAAPMLGKLPAELYSVGSYGGTQLISAGYREVKTTSGTVWVGDEVKATRNASTFRVARVYQTEQDGVRNTLLAHVYHPYNQVRKWVSSFSATTGIPVVAPSATPPVNGMCDVSQIDADPIQFGRGMRTASDAQLAPFVLKLKEFPDAIPVARHLAGTQGLDVGSFVRIRCSAKPAAVVAAPKPVVEPAKAVAKPVKPVAKPTRKGTKPAKK